VFLSNNRIEKLDNVSCIKECSQLSELALDGNPIYSKKGYMEFCLNNCPNLKQLDMRKVTKEMRSDPASANNFEEGDRNTIANKGSISSAGDASTATAT